MRWSSPNVCALQLPLLPHTPAGAFWTSTSIRLSGVEKIDESQVGSHGLIAKPVGSDSNMSLQAVRTYFAIKANSK
jgi:hypothetical protein